MGPNPVAERINLSLLSNPNGVMVSLYDQVGRQQLTQKVSAGILSTDITVEHLPRGNYWLQISEGNLALVGHKVVLQ